MSRNVAGDDCDVNNPHTETPPIPPLVTHSLIANPFFVFNSPFPPGTIPPPPIPPVPPTTLDPCMFGLPPVPPIA